MICNFVNLSSAKVLLSVMENCVDLLHECLQSLVKGNGKGIGSQMPEQTVTGQPSVDSELVTWLLMFISHFSDAVLDDPAAASDPLRFNWDFIIPSGNAQNTGSGSVADARQRKTHARDSKDALRRRFKAFRAKFSGSVSVLLAFSQCSRICHFKLSRSI